MVKRALIKRAPTKIMISLKFSEKTEALKKDFKFWLKNNPAPKIENRIELEQFVEISRKWQARLAADHWVAVHWPEEYGGRGLSIVEEAVIQECLAEARAPQLINLFGLTMVGPVLIEHGTKEQKKRFLQKILTAEEIWCQGFSEPEAGSDLAAVKTKADLIEEKNKKYWLISGQKVWTSFAQIADWCFLLAKTCPEAPRYKNLSYLLMPMNLKGIKTAPLMQISGDKEFNELFLEEVKVPAENIVGAIGEGWKIAISTLMYERVVLTFSRHLQSEQLLMEIAEILKNKKASSAEKQAYGRLVAKSMAVRALALSHLVSYNEKNSPGAEGSLDKLGWSEVYQEIAKFALSLLEEKSLYLSKDGSYKDGLLQHTYLYSRGRTIAAGTSEIQRGIIAERVLGLKDL